MNNNKLLIDLENIIKTKKWYHSNINNFYFNDFTYESPLHFNRGCAEEIYCKISSNGERIKYDKYVIEIIYHVLEKYNIEEIHFEGMIGDYYIYIKENNIWEIDIWRDKN